MEKTAVVAIRDALLKNGNKAPFRVVFDNGVNVQLSSDMVCWDDSKEIIIAFCTDPEPGAFTAAKPFRLICSTYEHIQFIMANSNIDDMNEVIESLSSVVPAVSSNKETILKYLSNIADPDKFLSKKAFLPDDIRRDEKFGRHKNIPKEEENKD